MTISRLASGTKFSPFCTTPRQDTIRKFTPHYMAGDLSASRCGDIFLADGRNASSNYGIGSDGDIMCYVDEDNRAWTSSSPWNDNQAITVEVANLDNETGRITDQAWQSLIKLATDVCHRYNFRLNYDGTPNGSLTMHKMFAATDCPGPYIESHMGEIAATVNKNLDSGNYEYSGTAAGVATKSGGLIVVTDSATAYALGILGNFLFDQEQIFPYMITIDKDSPDLDFEKLKEFDVIGVCIDIGSYFSVTHQVNKVFRSPKLDAQVKACIKAKMPFGLFIEVKARNLQEAVEEVYEIKLAARKYPPQMGLWLKLNLIGDSKTKNDEIIEFYYKSLYDIGFNDQLGLYCPKEQLEKITWEEHCEKWYWWMDRHLSSVDRIHFLPTPKFFMYDNPGDEDALIEPDFENAKRLIASASSMGGTSSKLGTGGYTDVQELVAKIAETSNNLCTASGWCAQFVTDVFSEAHRSKSEIQVPYGNAIDYWTKWRSSGGTDKNAPVGSVVVGSGWPYNSDGTNPYGHVGVVLTNGRVADNVGRRRISNSIDEWANGQTAPCGNYRGYIGWVWANGQDLSKMGKMIGGITLQGDDVVTQCWNYFTQTLGFSKQATAAILGTWNQESGIDPTGIEGIYGEAYTIGPRKQAAMNDWAGHTWWLFGQYAAQGLAISQSAYYGDDGNLYPGVGFAGFTGPRVTQLFRFADEHGLPWYSVEAQLLLFTQDITTGGYQEINQDSFKYGTNIDSLVDRFVRIYEMPGGIPWSWLAARINAAYDVYNRFA